MKDNKILIGKVVEAQNDCIQGMIERDISLCDRVDVAEINKETSDVIISELHKTAVERYDAITVVQAKLDKLLAEKDTEIERLKEGKGVQHNQLERISEICSRFISASGAMDRGLITYSSTVEYVVDTLQDTIKEREDVAISYRDMYNELKGEALRDGYEGRHNDLTHQQALDYIISERNLMVDVDKEYCRKDNYERKYKRLVACIKRNVDASTHGILSDILRQHRENEAKYAKKVK